MKRNIDFVAYIYIFSLPFLKRKVVNIYLRSLYNKLNWGILCCWRTHGLSRLFHRMKVRVTFFANKVSASDRPYPSKLPPHPPCKSTQLRLFHCSPLLHHALFFSRFSIRFSWRTLESAGKFHYLSHKDQTVSVNICEGKFDSRLDRFVWPLRCYVQKRNWILPRLKRYQPEGDPSLICGSEN
jgi:hypothetical protein